MPTYKVTGRITFSFETEVDAVSKDEAIEKAEKLTGVDISSEEVKYESPGEVDDAYVHGTIKSKWDGE